MGKDKGFTEWTDPRYPGLVFVRMGGLANSKITTAADAFEELGKLAERIRQRRKSSLNANHLYNKEGEKIKD